MNRRTESYWEKRSIQRISAAEKSSIPYIRQVQNIYKNAAKDTIESVRAMYRAYYKNDNTFDMDALNSIASQGDVKRFLAQMKAKGLSTYLPDNFKGRMTRLELINAQIWGEVKKASVSEKITTTDLYEKVFENSYYQTGFDMAKGLGENIAFSTLDKRTVEKVLNQKFEGEDFSQRIWSNTDKLASQLSEIIARSIATGASVERTSREFRERFGVGISNATRLVRTETCYFENNAELAAYAEMGIEEFVFVATLDSRTSEICQSMDGQRFKLSKAMVGENVPPLHPNCRSTIVAYLGKGYEPETRTYRDPRNGRNYSIKNMNYNQWVDTLTSDSPDAFYSFKNLFVEKETKKTASELINESVNETGAVFKKYEKDLVYKDVDYHGTPHFSPKTKGIYLDIKNAIVGDAIHMPYETLFHESGHMVDFLSGQLSVNFRSGELSFYNVITSEIGAQIKELGVGGFRAKVTNATMGLKMNQKSGLFDIIGGATRNRIKYRVGHPTRYWNSQSVPKEAFANMFAASLVEDKASYNAMKTVLPKSVSFYNEIVKEMKNAKKS